MNFVLNYNEGYEVCVVMVNDRGSITTQPLRNFGDRQGDAKVFQLHDCPHLRLEQVKALVKNFNRNVKYHRISERQFKRMTDEDNR